MRMCHFRAQNGPFALNKIFLVQTIINTFIYLLTLLTVQNFKKNLQQTQSYEHVQFSGPIGKPVMSLVSFIHAYLRAKNHRQILTY